MALISPSHQLFQEYRQLLLDRLSVEKGRLIQQTLVYDCEGIKPGISKDDSQAWKEAIQIATDNYCENLGKVYIINAPWVFTSIWKVNDRFDTHFWAGQSVL